MGLSGDRTGIKGNRALARQTRPFSETLRHGRELQAVLPAGWILQAPAYFMQAHGTPAEPDLAPGYTLEVTRDGMIAQARIHSGEGALAASGYAAETDDTFVYDRIVTEPEHRRKGLGSALMMALRSTRQRPGGTELLVATEAGRHLYKSLGWRTLSPYVAASLPTI